MFAMLWFICMVCCCELCSSRRVFEGKCEGWCCDFGESCSFDSGVEYIENTHVVIDVYTWEKYIGVARLHLLARGYFDKIRLLWEMLFLGIWWIAASAESGDLVRTNKGTLQWDAEERQSFSWTSMIQGYARPNEQEAIMVANVIPDRLIHSTNTVVSSCAHLGDLEKEKYRSFLGKFVLTRLWLQTVNMMITQHFPRIFR